MSGLALGWRWECMPQSCIGTGGSSTAGRPLQAPTMPPLSARQVAFYFCLSLFFAPLLANIPPYATGPVLVLVRRCRAAAAPCALLQRCRQQRRQQRQMPPPPQRQQQQPPAATAAAATSGSSNRAAPPRPPLVRRWGHRWPSTWWASTGTRCRRACQPSSPSPPCPSPSPSRTVGRRRGGAQGSQEDALAGARAIAAQHSAAQCRPVFHRRMPCSCPTLWPPISAEPCGRHDWRHCVVDDYQLERAGHVLGAGEPLLTGGCGRAGAGWRCS